MNTPRSTKPHRFGGFCAIAALAFLRSFAQGAPADAAYSIVDLGALGGATSYGWDINNVGQICFTSSSKTHACFHSGGTNLDLGAFISGGKSWARKINSNGQVVGYSWASGSVTHAFLYKAGRMIDIGVLTNRNSYAEGINDAGQVVGSEGGVAFLYSDGEMTHLGTLGGDDSQANAINNLGDIVGYSSITGNIAQHAFLYNRGSMMDLGSLGGRTGFASAINDSGQIVGTSETSGFIPHAFLYTNGMMLDLGTSPVANSSAEGINNHGEIVGYDGGRAFIYRNGVWSDLNNVLPPGSGWTLKNAYSINDNGQIIGTGTNPSGQSHAFLLTQRPSLQIRTLGSSLLLSWPVSAGGFALFQSMSLSATNWTAVLTLPAIIDGQYQVSFPNAGNQFYRLQFQ